MARSGINIRIKRDDRFRSLDVVYDLHDQEFKNWVNSKRQYGFAPHKLTVAERYKVIEDLRDNGVPIYIDREILSVEELVI